jgi:hypothetical protein
MVAGMPLPGVALCYCDESGVPEVGANTSHYVLVGVAVPVELWDTKDPMLNAMKAPFGLAGAEIHTAWIARRYVEQEHIVGFEALSRADRRTQVRADHKKAVALALASGQIKKAAKLKREFLRYEPYIHLTRDERFDFLRAAADLLGSWTDVTLFGESVDKTAALRQPFRTPPDEAAFEQVVTRYEPWLARQNRLGFVVYDRNETVSNRLVALVERFRKRGTLWRSIHHLVEQPFFVESHLTPMIQLADLASYAVRRYCEKSETDLFDRVYPRFHRQGDRVVGLRHFTGRGLACSCRICLEH